MHLPDTNVTWPVLFSGYNFLASCTTGGRSKTVMFISGYSLANVLPIKPDPPVKNIFLKH